MAQKLKFSSPSFTQRLKGMLGVDFYRLFHTPLFYIFLLIAMLIPALIMGTSGMENPDGTVSAALYTNVWNAVAADTPPLCLPSHGGVRQHEHGVHLRRYHGLYFHRP